MSKTPQFDKAMADYFAKITPDKDGGQWRVCRFSGEKFYVRPEDVEFYKKIKVPLPTLSPVERMRRRMVYAPGYNFFKIKSAATGKMIVSMHSPKTAFKIYEHQIWFSHKFDAMRYGTDFDPKNNFFDEFRKLQEATPRPNLNTDPSNLNSDYTNNSLRLKNCYFAFDAIDGENLYYFECCVENQDCLDCWACNKANTCYGCWGDDLFQCFFVHDSYNCTESKFLFDCRNCEHCFMCANLRNKKYCFYNNQLTKEDYRKKISAINLGNYEELQKYLKEFEEMKINAIHRPVIEEQVINSTGTWIWELRDCFQVHYAAKSERVAYSLGFQGYRDSYDILGGADSELCYEMVNMQSENNYGIKFSTFVNESRDLEYCDLCRNCHDCFGSIGLYDKSFCVFNKQYGEREYWQKVDEIKTAMFSRGEYGEFFPPEMSTYPYNLSFISAYPGYDEPEIAKHYGYRFEEREESHDIAGLETISSSNLPLDIKDVDDSILNKAVLDEENKFKFRITKYELGFYRRFHLPLPRVAPTVRMTQWRKDLDLRARLYDRVCARCGRKMQAMYASQRPEKNIYCKGCYYEAVS